MRISKQKLCRFVTDNLQAASVLVIGDVMLDKYYFGEVQRISPEAPVPITRVVREKETLGGAANVAHNLARLGCQTYLAGVVGQDAHYESLRSLLEERAVSPAGLAFKAGPTTTKLRVIGGHQQMLRLDFEENEPLAVAVEGELRQYILERLADGVRCVILSDYGKGVCTPALCRFVIAECQAREIPILVDPKGNDWTKYAGAAYITPNLKELNAVALQPINNMDDEVKTAAQRIRRKYKLSYIMVTRSEKGLSLIGTKRCLHIPTLAQEVFDVSGAGDTVIAVMAAALAAGMVANEAAFLANLAAGVVVGKVGTYAISQKELLQALQQDCSLKEGEEK